MYMVNCTERTKAIFEYGDDFIITTSGQSEVLSWIIMKWL